MVGITFVSNQIGWLLGDYTHLMNRDGQNMQINMPKYAHKHAEEIAKYATKYAL